METAPAAVTSPVAQRLTQSPEAHLKPQRPQAGPPPPAKGDGSGGANYSSDGQSKKKEIIPPLQLAWCAPIIADYRMGLTELMNPVRAVQYVRAYCIHELR